MASPPLRTYTLTFNCAREPLNPSNIAPHLFAALPPASSPSSPRIPPDIIIISLQEVAPIAYAFLGGGYLQSYLAPFHCMLDLAASTLDEKVEYEHVVTRNVGMTVIMVFALKERGAVGRVAGVEVAGVGFGVWGMGNKGAVGVRLRYAVAGGEEGEMNGDGDGERAGQGDRRGKGNGKGAVEITAIAAHLAPMEGNVERRNEDWKSAVRGLVFTRVEGDDTVTVARRRKNNSTTSDNNEAETEPLLASSQAEQQQPPSEAEGAEQAPNYPSIYTPTTHLLLAGDLNYRTSPLPPLTEEYRSFPQPTPSPTSPEHYSHLFESDQLTAEMREGRVFQGFSEGEVGFGPTYKFSDRARRDADGEGGGRMDGEGGSWGWARHRWPSWCDRVLFVGMPSWGADKKEEEGEVVVKGYTALPLLPSSDHRPVVCCIDLPRHAIPPPPTDDISTMRKEDTVRLNPPFPLDPDWQQRRAWARRREVVVGLGAWLVLTWEGRGVLLAMLVGGVGGWSVVGGMVGGGWE